MNQRETDRRQEQSKFPTVLIQSHYSLVQLPPAECEEDNSLMKPTETQYSFGGATIRIVAESTPAYKCLDSKHGGTYFPSQVTLDLLEQVSEKLHGTKDPRDMEHADSIRRTQETLQRLIAEDDSSSLPPLPHWKETFLKGN